MKSFERWSIVGAGFLEMRRSAFDGGDQKSCSRSGVLASGVHRGVAAESVEKASYACGALAGGGRAGEAVWYSSYVHKSDDQLHDIEEEGYRASSGHVERPVHALFCGDPICASQEERCDCLAGDRDLAT